MDRLDEQLGPGVLEQEAAGAGPQRAVDVLVEVERRDDHDGDRVRRRPARRAGGSPRCRPARASGCRTGTRRAAAAAPARRGLVPVGRLADDLDVGLGVEDHRQPGAHQLLVVGDQHPDRHRRHLPSAARRRPSSRRSGAGPARSVPPSSVRPLGHPDEPVAAARRPRRVDLAVVAHAQPHAPALAGDPDRRRGWRSGRAAARWSPTPAPAGRPPRRPVAEVRRGRRRASHLDDRGRRRRAPARPGRRCPAAGRTSARRSVAQHPDHRAHLGERARRLGLDRPRAPRRAASGRCRPRPGRPGPGSRSPRRGGRPCRAARGRGRPAPGCGSGRARAAPALGAVAERRAERRRRQQDAEPADDVGDPGVVGDRADDRRRPATIARPITTSRPEPQRTSA